MKSLDYEIGLHKELLSACSYKHDSCSSEGLDESILKSIGEELHLFFAKNRGLEYNEFLKKIDEEYGFIIERYRKDKKLKMVKTIRNISIFFMLTVCISILCSIIFYFVALN